MAFRVGITGMPNSGKSFAWSKYDKGEEVFSICPSSKIIHVRDSDGKLPKELEIAIKGKGNGFEEIMKNTKLQSKHSVIRKVVTSNIPVEDVKVKGNLVHCSDVKYVQYYKLFVSKYMPNIKIILCPDFTHYISYVISSKTFMSMKAGGQAFQRFWDLAADVLNNVIHIADKLRPDILDFTEFHAEYNEDLDLFGIYTPAGKMLTEKFKPETYFDVMLHTKVLPYEQEPNDAKRFKFVVNKQGKYDGRSIGLFTDISKDGMIPNDMGIVIKKLRAYLG